MFSLPRLYLGLLLGLSSLLGHAQSTTQHYRCATCQHPYAASSSHLSHKAAKTALYNHSTALQASATPRIIDLLLAYDPKGRAVAEKEGGMEAHAQHAVALSNEVLRHSGIAAEFRLVGTVSISEVVHSITEGLGLGIGHPTLRQKRRETGADIVVLCSEPFNDGHSGIATLESNANSAFASVRASAATSSYTVVHEIGHIFGCHHSRESLDGGDHPYAVGASRVPYYTVMGFPELEGLTEQAPLFSGPHSVWKGVVMGSETENCVRKILERLDEVAAFDLALGGYRLDRSTWEINHQAQQLPLRLTTDSFFFIESNAPWLTPSVTDGFGNTSFTLSATANTTGQTRTATLTIYGNEDYNPTKLLVRQDAPLTAITPIPTTAPALTLREGQLLLQLDAPTHLTLLDAAGRTLRSYALSPGTQVLSLSHRGVLFMQLTNAHGVSTQKIIAP